VEDAGAVHVVVERRQEAPILRHLGEDRLRLGVELVALFELEEEAVQLPGPGEMRNPQKEVAREDVLGDSLEGLEVVGPDRSHVDATPALRPWIRSEPVKRLGELFEVVLVVVRQLDLARRNPRLESR
jgi:hypothetical protein